MYNIYNTMYIAKMYYILSFDVRYFSFRFSIDVYKNLSEQISNVSKKRQLSSILNGTIYKSNILKFNYYILPIQ